MYSARPLAFGVSHVPTGLAAARIDTIQRITVMLCGESLYIMSAQGVDWAASCGAGVGWFGDHEESDTEADRWCARDALPRAA